MVIVFWPVDPLWRCGRATKHSRLCVQPRLQHDGGGGGVDGASPVAAVAPAGAFEPETGFITSIRHQQLLSESAEYLEKAAAALDAEIPHEMLLVDLYEALRPIDAITGATTADDILHRIFSTFCIGK